VPGQVQLSPHRADEALGPVQGAQPVLAVLLVEDDLLGAQIAAVLAVEVLAATVELGGHTVLGPGEVGVPDETLRVVVLPLQHRCREPEAVEHDPLDGLAGRLRERVGEPADPRRDGPTALASAGGELVDVVGAGGEAEAEGSVEGRDRLRARRRQGHVDEGAGGTGQTEAAEQGDAREGHRRCVTDEGGLAARAVTVRVDDARPRPGRPEEGESPERGRGQVRHDDVLVQSRHPSEREERTAFLGTQRVPVGRGDVPPGRHADQFTSGAGSTLPRIVTS